MSKWMQLPAIALVLILIPSAAVAGTIGFFQISSPLVTPDVASQLSVDMTDPGSGKVSFTFHNTSTIASSITDIYFADGTLLGISEITSSPGVQFSRYAKPENLPGGKNLTPPFITTQGFSLDSDPAVLENGVNNSGEFVTVLFSLINGKTFSDTERALISGALRIGVKVQGLPGGKSASFVNTPPENVPEPSLILLLGIGLGAATLVSRRRNS